MKTKSFSLFLLFIVLASASNAQQPIMLFDDFRSGTVYLKKRITTKAELNYDARNGKMIYLLDDQEMTLTNNHEVDSIVFDDSKFILYKKIYLEVANESNGSIFINWKLRESLKGYRGAMGLTTQTKIESIDLSHITTKKNVQSTAEITKIENNNEYWFYVKGKLVKCRNEKNLMKQFPNNKEQLRDFIKREKIRFKNPTDAIRLINFALSL